MTARSVTSALFVILVIGAAIPISADAQGNRPETSRIESPDATVWVDGLACPFCAYGIEKKLNALGPIQNVEVQLENGRVLLAFTDDQSLTREEIQQAVKKAGFTARRVEFSQGQPVETPSS